MHSSPHPALRRERWKLTAHLVRALDKPMLLLSAVWSVLLVIEFTRGLSPWLQTLNDVIWGAFVAQFVVEFATAPSKRVYLRKRWVTACPWPSRRSVCFGSFGSPAWLDSLGRSAGFALPGC